MKMQILSLLRARRDYVSGQELCEQFGVSRTAVWKAVEQLKKEGYCIEAVRNRGYLLQETQGDVYSAEEIRHHLHTRYIGQNISFYQQIDSTNIEAKHQGEVGAPEGTLIAADQQTAGRGRRGRNWISPAGINTYFTLMLRPEIDAQKAPMVTLVMAMAVAQGMEKLRRELTASSAEEAIRIKWPNDIVMGGRKLCGILTEMSLEREFIQYVVIGVGINVKHQEFAPEIAATADCLEDAWGVSVPRSALVAAVMDAFEPLYEAYLKNGDLSGLKDEYESMLVNLNQQVRVMDPQGEYVGIARGIDAQGELLVEREDGSVETVFAGEVSVRGVYGYV